MSANNNDTTPVVPYDWKHLKYKLKDGVFEPACCSIYDKPMKVILTVQVILLLACFVVCGLLFDVLKTYQDIGIRLGKLERSFNRWVSLEMEHEERMKELSIFAEKNGYKNYKFEEGTEVKQ